ncbi:MAG: outer membrane lipoprotein-sorting protein [Salinisphaeraceae bacterium]|nr:outer membrane lipoprotein-sorting protein [Salinisphaeraceae bacterium]
MLKKRLPELTIALLASLLLAAPAQAQTPEEKGMAITVEADKRNSGWGDSKVDMEMILRNRQGQESTRELRSQSLEKVDEGDWSMIIFDKPKDVKGTALLTYSYKEKDDDQWLFLPALKRVKRIASNNKSGPFMGSEFAYEDLSSQEIEKYTDYKWLRDEACGDGLECFVIQRVPVDEKSGYTKQIAWLDKEEYRVYKVDFYDRKDELLKTLTASDFQLYKDEHWRPGKLEMVNHQTGKSTTLLFKNYVFGNGFTDRDFDQNSLKSAR